MKSHCLSVGSFHPTDSWLKKKERRKTSHLVIPAAGDTIVAAGFITQVACVGGPEGAHTWILLGALTRPPPLKTSAHRGFGLGCAGKVLDVGEVGLCRQSDAINEGKICDHPRLKRRMVLNPELRERTRMLYMPHR